MTTDKRTVWPVGWLVFWLIMGVLLAGCSKDLQQQQRSALHHFKLGNQAYRAEDYTRAIHQFELAVELDHQSPDLHYNLGLAHYVTGNYNAAVLSLQDALALNPVMPDAHYNLALAYDKLYNAPAAHSHYNAYRNMIAGNQEPGGPRSALPPPPNTTGGKPALVNQAQRNLALGEAGAQTGAGGNMTPGRPQAGGVADANGIPSRARRMEPPYRSATGSNQSGMPQGVRQKLPMANQAQPAAHSGAVQQTDTSPKKEQPLLGGSDQWWIHDRFSRKW